MKNLKLFEQYSEDYDHENAIADSIFEDWKSDLDEDLNSVFEADDEDESWDDDDSALTSGEKAALARDFQILTKPQLAAIYLRALGKEESNDYGKYTILIDGIRDFGDVNKDSGEFKLTVPALADAIGLDSMVTVSRTGKKFRNLISGQGETQGEAIYPKIIKVFNEFSSRTPSQIAVLAGEAIQDPMMFTKNRDAAIASGPRSAAQRLEQKINQIKMGEKVHSLINSLKSADRVDIYRKDPAKAQRAAVARIARELDITPERVELAYSKYKKDRGINY